MDSIQAKILTRIRRLGPGKVHVSKDFLDLGSRAAVDQALSRLVQEKAVHRLARGLYYIPKTNPTMGIELPPDMDAIAQAIARKTGSRIVPSGAVAANEETDDGDHMASWAEGPGSAWARYLPAIRHFG